MKLFRGNRKTACGLDLGHRWAKLVRLKPARKKAALDRMARMPWRRDDWDQKDQAASKIKSLWKNTELQNKTVITSLAGHAVIIKRMDLPASETKNLEETIYKQAKQYIPFDVNDVYLDFQILGPGREAESKNVVLVASKQKMVQDLQDIFQKSDLGIQVVDVDGFALSNCFEFNYPEMVPESSYILDIGGGHSIFCVYSQNKPLFIRDIGFGGDQLTERISETLQMNTAEAEKTKLSRLKSLESQTKKKVQSELENILISWADEIQRLINLYQNSQQDDAPAAKRLYLAGGGSLTAGLADILSEELDLEVSYLNPWRNVSCDEYAFDTSYLQSAGPQFAVAVGLALRTVQ